MNRGLKSIFRILLRAAYGARLNTAEDYTGATRLIFTPNHVSFLDAALAAVFLPGDPVFAINTQTAQKWWVKPFVRLVDAFPVDPANPMSMKSLIRLVASGRNCVIFPEGRLSRTGGLMKIYDGPGMIADKAGARIVPVRIHGAEYSPFSFLKGKLKRRLFPRVSMTALAPRSLDIPEGPKGRARRRLITDRLYDIMAEMMFETSDVPETLFQALLDAARVNGGRHHVLEDIARQPMSFRKLVLGSLVLGRRLEGMTQPGEHVGLLLPNANGAAVTFFALQARGRVPAMLNFSAGPATVREACALAEVRLVLTSRLFIEKGHLEPAIAALEGLKIVYLEDLRQELGLAAKLGGLLALPFASRTQSHIQPHSPAVILFTSGSEGTPKGVVLSHSNILSNCRQLASVVDFTPRDRVLNALPIFHSFGLTGGLLLPVLNGVRTFLYPSPLHYRIVPELAYDTGATIMFGTDTFLTGYARTASAYDFYKMRYVFAGAERVREETRKAWMEKFGVRILEGYGATETSPVIALNTPMHTKSGTAGRLLPGVETRLEKMEGIEAGAKLSVKGPNVMLGYLKADQPGVLQPPAGGWYDTGDIVSFDEAGYLTIEGRVKRFAKIAGEMVSLGRVEAELAALWPDNHHAIVTAEDPKRGEQLVLVTDKPGAERGEVQKWLQNKGLPELMVPRRVQVVEKVPLLGSGKTDYREVGRMLEGV